MIEVRLFASLRKYLPPNGDGTKVNLQVPHGSRLDELIERLGVPPQLAQLVLVDGVHETNHQRTLVDGAILSIFPPVAGGNG